MKDWELLRDELAAEIERQDVYGKLSLEEFNNGCYLRVIETENALADTLESTYYSYIKDNILTQDIITKYQDFFDRQYLPTDIKEVMELKEAAFARREELKKAREYERLLYEKKDYSSDYKRIRKHIGKQLKDARIGCGYTIHNVSLLTGIRISQISRIEEGRGNHGIDIISTLATVYKATITIHG